MKTDHRKVYVREWALRKHLSAQRCRENTGITIWEWKQKICLAYIFNIYCVYADAVIG